MPANDTSRVISIVLVLCGLTIIAYAGAVIVEAIAGGVLTGVLAERRRERAIERLTDHYIICGYGRVGQRVAEEFRAADERYVVLDLSEIAVAAAKEHGDLFVHGDATDDDDLVRAGLGRAKGIVVASDSDADNLYITLSARSARPDIQIVARASDVDAEKKLKLAGADRVVMPYTAAGRTMANLVLKPQVTAFLDAVTTAAGPDLHMASIEVDRSCANAGRTIRDIRVRHETGAIVVALRKQDGRFDTAMELLAAAAPGRLRTEMLIECSLQLGTTAGAAEALVALDQLPPEEPTPPLRLPAMHANVRGPDYYAETSRPSARVDELVLDLDRRDPSTELPLT